MPPAQRRPMHAAVTIAHRPGWAVEGELVLEETGQEMKELCMRHAARDGTTLHGVAVHVSALGPESVGHSDSFCSHYLTLDCPHALASPGALPPGPRCRCHEWRKAKVSACSHSSAPDCLSQCARGRPAQSAADPLLRHPHRQAARSFAKSPHCFPPLHKQPSFPPLPPFIAARSPPLPVHTSSLGVDKVNGPCTTPLRRW